MQGAYRSYEIFDLINFSGPSFFKCTFLTPVLKNLDSIVVVKII